MFMFIMEVKFIELFEYFNLFTMFIMVVLKSIINRFKEEAIMEVIKSHFVMVKYYFKFI
jgi:hypothetical protein